MTILEAYCVELSRTVTIEEAHEEYHGKGGGKRFNFSCADETCRFDHGMKPVVSGVNYDRAAQDLGRVTMHFRRIKPEDHRDACPYADHELAIEEIDRDPALPRARRIRASQLVSRLDLSEPAVTRNTPGADTVAAPPSAGTGRSTTAQVLYTRLCRSTRLYRVVDCYLLMSPEERPKRRLAIGTLLTDYQKAFVYSEDLNEYRHPQILRGFARCDDVEGCPTLVLHRRNETTPVIHIRLTAELLQTSRLAQSYLNYVRDVSRKSRFAIRLFAIGRRVRVGEVIDFRVAHLNHLVVMDREAGKYASNRRHTNSRAEGQSSAMPRTASS